MSPEPAPRLRTVSARPGEHDGTVGVFLDDPLGVARDTQFLPLSSWRIAASLDGRATCAGIAETLNEETAAALAEADVAAVVDGLSRRLLLEDEAFERALESELQRFRDAGLRPLVGAGSDYEGNAFALRIELAGLVADDWDMPPLPHAAGCWAPGARIAEARALYARSYASIRHARPARVVVLASAGARLPRLGVPLDMDLETPFGSVSVDREGLAALGLFAGAEVLCHRDHLAIERHALFLRLCFPRAAVLPLLIGDVDATAESDAVEELVDGLARVAALDGGTLFVCAADLGCVSGEQSTLAQREEDAECIDCATRLDVDGLWQNGATGTADRSRRAQLAAPHVFLRTLRAVGPELRGSTLGYQQFGSRLDPPGSVRAAASVVFH